MKTQIGIGFVFCIFLVVFFWSTKMVPKLLIIGIDGTRSDAFLKAQTPVMDKLSFGGKYFFDVNILSDKNTGADTASGPGWSTILTGVWPDKHGVKNNHFRHHNLYRYTDLACA